VFWGSYHPIEGLTSIAFNYFAQSTPTENRVSWPICDHLRSFMPPFEAIISRPTGRQCMAR
jgi:hypothetical protein